MYSNNLYFYFADPTGMTFHSAHGAAVASVTAEGVETYATTLRPVEVDHLNDVAADFARYHAAAFAGENYDKQHMPILK